MEQTVTVTDVMGHEALVRGRRASACGQCAGKSACGTLGSWTERFAEMCVDNALRARIGDEVVIDIPEGVLMRAALRLYGIPMLGFFAAGFMVRYIAIESGTVAPELWAVGGALSGMIAAFVWLRRASEAQSSTGARIVRIKSHAPGIPARAA